MIKTLLIILTITFSSSAISSSFFIDNNNIGKITKKNVKFISDTFSFYAYVPKERLNSKMYVVMHGEYSKTKEFFEMTSLQKSFEPESLFLSPDSINDDWFNDKKIKENKTMLNKLIKDYINKYRIKELYFIGYSTGGLFASNIACDYEEFKGIALINSPLNNESFKSCSEIKNKKVLFSYGDKSDFFKVDNNSKYNEIFKEPPLHLSFEETSKKLISQLKCNNKTEFYYPDRDPKDGSKLLIYDYECEFKYKNKLNILIFENMGHTYPSNNSFSLSDFRGNPNNDINLSRKIIDFFNTK
jgi:predicted esterase